MGFPVLRTPYSVLCGAEQSEQFEPCLFRISCLVDQLSIDLHISETLSFAGGRAYSRELGAVENR